MKTLNMWLDEYSASHQHPTNKLIHWVCVPAILFSIIGAVYQLSPLASLIAVLFLLAFYARLDLPLTVCMAVLLASMFIAIKLIPLGFSFYTAIFVFAWIFQFYGHKLEGKKPSFFSDIQFLAVGPAWCMHALMTKLRLARV